MYPPDARPVKWLKQNETLPGGATAVYMADFMLRLDQTKPLKEDEEMKVKGFICGVTLCKSRSNASGHYMSVVFDQHRGADNVLTNYLMLKDSGLVVKSGNGFALKGLETVKFMQSTVRETYASNEAFRAHFDELTRGELSCFIKEIHSKVSTEAEEAIEAMPDHEINRGDVLRMSLKELKALAKETALDVEADYWKEPLEEVRVGIADALFPEGEEKE